MPHTAPRLADIRARFAALPTDELLALQAAVSLARQTVDDPALDRGAKKKAPVPARDGKSAKAKKSVEDRGPQPKSPAASQPNGSDPLADALARAPEPEVTMPGQANGRPYATAYQGLGDEAAKVVKLAAAATSNWYEGGSGTYYFFPSPTWRAKLEAARVPACRVTPRPLDARPARAPGAPPVATPAPARSTRFPETIEELDARWGARPVLWKMVDEVTALLNDGGLTEGQEDCGAELIANLEQDLHAHYRQFGKLLSVHLIYHEPAMLEAAAALRQSLGPEDVCYLSRRLRGEEHLVDVLNDYFNNCSNYSRKLQPDWAGDYAHRLE